MDKKIVIPSVIMVCLLFLVPVVASAPSQNNGVASPNNVQRIETMKGAHVYALYDTGDIKYAYEIMVQDEMVNDLNDAGPASHNTRLYIAILTYDATWEIIAIGSYQQDLGPEDTFVWNPNHCLLILKSLNYQLQPYASSGQELRIEWTATESWQHLGAIPNLWLASWAPCEFTMDGLAAPYVYPSMNLYRGVFIVS